MYNRLEIFKDIISLNRRWNNRRIKNANVQISDKYKEILEQYIICKGFFFNIFRVWCPLNTIFLNMLNVIENIVKFLIVTCFLLYYILDLLFFPVVLLFAVPFGVIRFYCMVPKHDRVEYIKKCKNFVELCEKDS